MAKRSPCGLCLTAGRSCWWLSYHSRISTLPLFGELNRLYGDRVAFTFVYTREAHAGKNVGQPVTLAEKIEPARC